eukprot:1348428-Amorphochlora_amoeboformis.AAC.1
MIRRHASSSLPTTNRDASSGHTTTNRDTSSNHVVTTRETSPIQVVTKRDTWPGHSVTNRGATINLSLEMKRHSPSVKSHTNLTTTRSATVAIITDNMRRDFKRLGDPSSCIFEYFYTNLSLGGACIDYNLLFPFSQTHLHPNP